MAEPHRKSQPQSAEDVGERAVNFISAQSGKASPLKSGHGSDFHYLPQRA
jgi:hypothetical protein